MELTKQEKKWKPIEDRANIYFAQEVRGTQISVWLYLLYPYL